MNKFEIIPNDKKEVETWPVSTKLPLDEHEKLAGLAKKNGFTVSELSAQMLLHCLKEVDYE